MGLSLVIIDSFMTYSRERHNTSYDIGMAQLNSSSESVGSFSFAVMERILKESIFFLTLSMLRKLNFFMQLLHCCSDKPTFLKCETFRTLKEDFKKKLN